MIISLHKYLYFSTEIHPRLLLVAIFKYSDNTQERGIKPKKVTLSLKNVIFGLVCRDYVSEISQYIRIFHIVEFSNHSPTVAWHCGIVVLYREGFHVSMWDAQFRTSEAGDKRHIRTPYKVS